MTIAFMLKAIGFIMVYQAVSSMLALLKCNKEIKDLKTTITKMEERK